MSWIRQAAAAAFLVIWHAALRLENVAGLQTATQLQVVLAEHHGVMFCHECADPLREGSYLPLLASLSSPHGFFVATDLVYGVPNKGNMPLLNEDEVRGRVVLFDRGKVSFSRKVRFAQEAGAHGVIIVDNTACSDRHSSCFDAQSYSPSVATIEADGTVQIKSRDSATAWIGIQIPSVLVSAADGDRLRRVMRLGSFDFDGERQYINEN